MKAQNTTVASVRCNLTSLILNDRLNRPAYWMFICIFLGIRIGAVVLTEMGYISGFVRLMDFILFFVASVLGARLRDFGWSAFWGWAGVAVFNVVVPLGIIFLLKPVLLPSGGLSGSAGGYNTLLSTLPFFALIVAVGSPPSDPNSKYRRPSQYNIVVSESARQFAQHWILPPLSIFRRRVSRSAYWAGLVIVLLILFAQFIAEESNKGRLLVASLLALAVAVAALLAAARLRDFGWSGLWGWGSVVGLSLAVPIATISLIGESRMVTLPMHIVLGSLFLCMAVIVIVGIPAGNPGPNKYGPPFRWKKNNVA
ncbi:DUF805 domain-containing protein [Rhizobium sp. SEMIA 4088]|nr:DUF805 domain-containing protein [Rhizobium sp. SEMIA 4088]